MDELGDHLVVARRRRMFERLDHQSPLAQPSRRVRVDTRRRVRLGVGELRACVLGEQWVDPIPRSSLESLDEEVRMLEIGQDGRRVGAAEDGIAEVGRDLTEDSSSEHERTLVVVHRRHDLSAQVFGEETVIAPEVPDHGVWVTAGPQPETGQDQRGRPAFRPFDQLVDLRLCDLQLPPCHEKVVGLRGRERELCGSKLDEGLRDAQSCQVQGRIRAADRKQAHVRREVRDRMVERPKALGAGHRVQIVQHQHDGSAERSHPVEQLLDRVLRGAHSRIKTLERPSPETLPDAIHGRRHVAPEADRIVIDRVESDPRQRCVDTRAPDADGGGLAVARRCGDERQGDVVPVEHAPDPRPVHGSGTHRWRRELRLGEREVPTGAAPCSRSTAVGLGHRRQSCLIVVGAALRRMTRSPGVKHRLIDGSTDRGS